MARRAITKELYNALLGAYRLAPGNASNAARIAFCDRRTAKRAWELGWPKVAEWALPIRETMRLEFEEARADRERLVEKEREDQVAQREAARRDAARTVEEETKAVQIARANSIALGGIMNQLMRGMLPLAKRTVAQLESEEFTPKVGMKLMQDMGFVIRQGNEAIRLAMELERLRLGEPTDQLGISKDMDDVTAEEAVEELLGLERTLQRAAKAAGPLAAALIEDNGVLTIDLPQDAFEEDEAEVIELASKRKKRKAGAPHKAASK